MADAERTEITPPSAGGSEPYLVVGVGASAGGLEALERFFDSVPPDAPLALVVVQHLQPGHPSSMAEILAKHTSMPVRQAEDGARVEPGHAYLIPPSASLAIEGGRLRVTPLEEPRRALIDQFFFSLAADQGYNAVGILLSGAGTDGTLGFKAIKEHGGLTLAQELKSAQFDSMPRSAISLGLVDHELRIEDMPAKLLEYRQQLSTLAPSEKGRAVRPSEFADKLGTVCLLLLRRTGHDFSKYKQPTLIRRIQRRMLVNSVASVADYVELLRAQPDEVTQLFKDLLIGVTHFFRDAESFDALATSVLPRILQSKTEDREVRVWVSGCASGEEAYSIAILLREAMGALDVAPTVKIFATDIDDHALDVARLGQYTEGITEHVSAERLERFFIKQGGTYQIDKTIREMCIFSTHNLLRDPPFSRLHLISCRNLLIYLESDIQKKLVPVFHYALRCGGFLFLGPSESIAASPEMFTMVDKKSRIFQRNDAVIPPIISFPVLGTGRAPAHAPEAAARPQTSRGQDVAKTFERVLIDNYSPSAAVINERGEIIYVSGRTGKYLELPSGVTSVNIIEMARKGLRPDLHTAIHRAIKTRQETFHEDVSVELNGYIQRLNLSVRPLSEIEPGSGLLMVVFHELGLPVTREEAAAAGLLPRTDDQLAQVLENELRSTKEHLRTSIEEFEASNEEIKSANEELLSTNEELQSTNEELQTSKEELQSINEELQTVNSELSRKVEELDRANSDLQNLFANTNVATIFLDSDLRIKKFSPEATEVFRLIGSDVGRPLTDIAATFTDGDLIGNVREVLRTLVPCEHQVRRIDRDQWYIQRIRPYRSLDNVISGAVLTIVDITSLKLAEQRIVRLASLVESSQEAIIGTTVDGWITSWNAGAQRIFGYTADEVIGRSASLFAAAGEVSAMDPLYEKLKRGIPVEPIEMTRLRKDGRQVHTLLTLSPVREGPSGVSGISMIAHDITERKQREEELAALLSLLETERGRLQTLVDHVPFGIALVESAGQRVILQNPRATQILEQLAISSKEPGQEDSSGFFQADGRPVKVADLPLSRSLRGELVQGEDYLYSPRPGEQAWIRSSAGPIVDGEGAVTGSVITFSDVDKERRAEQALQEVDRRKNEFLAMLGHELRNPLTPIRNAAYTMRRFDHSEPVVRQSLDRIDRQVTHMVRLIDDLLDMSRISTGKILLHKQPIDLVELTRAVVHDHFTSEGKSSLTLDLSLPGEPVWVLGDPVRLSQVIANLLYNAVKFTDSGGRISVTLTTSREGETASIIVKDTGIGMDEGTLARAFVPFAQADGSLDRGHGGLGLGLALVKELVELHGGSAQAASDGIGHGSELTLCFPLSAPPDASSQADGLADGSAEARRLRVLVIEDNMDINESIRLILELSGHEVDVAYTGQDGLATARAFQPEVVLCDIGLPGGLDGYDVARALRGDPTTSSAHLIALTGYGQDEDQRRAFEAGFEKHLTKPFEPSDIQALLQSLPARAEPPLRREPSALDRDPP